MAEIITVKTTEELTLFFVENVYGGNAYYIIFKNKNKVEWKS
jgi:hypothetical protein